MFSNVLTAFGPMELVDPACVGEACAMERTPPDPKVFGGIVIGITAGMLWQRFHRLKLVPWLAFFGGRRFVPIITAVAGHRVGGRLRPRSGRALGGLLSDFAELAVRQSARSVPACSVWPTGH